MMMMITKCPICSGDIGISEDPDIGSQLLCIHCSTEFEVTWLFPLTLDLLVNNSHANGVTVKDENT